MSWIDDDKQHRVSRISRPWAVAALLAALALAGSSAMMTSTACAQEGRGDDAARQRASAHFRRGVALFEEGDREAALVEFQRAYEAYPSYHVLYNIGQTALSLRRYVVALRALERYMAEGGDAISPERAADVQAMISTLESRTAHVTIVVNVPGARIRLDDEILGTSPLEGAVVVDVGRHTLSVTANGYNPFEREIVVAGGDEQTVEVELVRADQVVQVVAPVTQGPDNTAQHFGIAGFVLTGLTAGTAVVMGVLGLRAHEELQDHLAIEPADPNAVADARDNAFAFGLAADVLTGVSLALGVTSLVLVLLDTGDTEEEREAEAVSVHPTPGGFAVRF